MPAGRVTPAREQGVPRAGDARVQLVEADALPRRHDRRIVRHVENVLPLEVATGA